MKLYATVIGLKNGSYVEKGQGSNQSLAIEIKAEGLRGIPTRANMYRLSLNIGNDNELQAELLNYSTGEIIQLKSIKNTCSEHNDGMCYLSCPWRKHPNFKAKKQKGE